MGPKAPKRKNKAEAGLNSRVQAAHEIHERRYQGKSNQAQEKIDVTCKFADIEQQKWNLEHLKEKTERQICEQ